MSDIWPVLHHRNNRTFTSSSTIFARAWWQTTQEMKSKELKSGVIYYIFWEHPQNE